MMRLLSKLATRHRVGIQDLFLVFIIVLAAGYFFYVFDFLFLLGASPAPNTIDLAEMFLLGLILAAGLLIFAARQLHMQKAETERRIEAERQMRRLAFQDSLTGLANRRSLNDALKAVVGAPPRAEGAHALLVLDLNNFKQVNDVYGHGAGDETLMITAQRIVPVVRANDLVARLGGDEFAVLARDLAGAEAVTSIARRIAESLAKPIEVNGVGHQMSAALGICLFPFDGMTVEEILRRADVAMYDAKANRKQSIHFFDEAMDRHLKERGFLERELQAAIRNKDIQPYFQPLVDLKTKQITGFEAIARWHHKDFGEIPPARFIPIAEDTGQIGALTDQLLRSACEVALTWPPHVRLSFNISLVDLKDPIFSLRVLAILSQTQMTANRLELEITESAMVHDLETVQQVLGTLRETGLRVALDDFGTGYSSLYHLRNFKIDTIKIDRNFIHSMSVEPESAEIVNALLGLGKGLGLTIVAEGIEEGAQAAALQALGCQEGQGFLFSEAISAERSRELVSGVHPPFSYNRRQQ